MKELLNTISILSIRLGEMPTPASESQIANHWLGFEPANLVKILEAEKRLQITLPADYKVFLAITNGFLAPNNVEPTFLKVEEIDYLKNVDHFTIEAYQIPELENSILVAGRDEEQYFLLIPPESENKEWRYWIFANWFPGEHEFDDLGSYFNYVLEFCQKTYDDDGK